jgi:hypothetical protein
VGSNVPPLVMSSTGPVPTPPSTLREELTSAVAATNPGYTSDLPGTLIEDIASTDTQALVLIDSARVELVDSLTPYGANAYLANQLGNIYGVPIGVGSNTSVEVVFFGTVGFVIIPGFTVSDGSYQYIVQDGGVIGSSGSSAPLSALATQQGVWPVAANTVVTLITSVPNTIELTVTNPQAGLPGSNGQLISDYQAQVLQAGLAASTGMTRYLKTLLENVDGVQPRLVSVRQQTGGGWEVLVGGGDNYQVANAIFEALFDVSTLVGSVMSITEITNANPGVVTTLLNHGFTGGSQIIEIEGVEGMTQVNGSSFTIDVLTPTTFSLGADTRAFGTYTGGGVITPNLRNVAVSIYDYPDQYEIPFVAPPQQTVAVALTWNTLLVNFTGGAAVAQLGNPVIVEYINSIAVGQPMNLFELQAAFQEAVAPVLAPQNLTRMVFSVSIDGVPTAPEAGTGIIPSDPESYFYAVSNLVTIMQG